jgi:Flp pilus assembly pilin Flp
MGKRVGIDPADECGEWFRHDGRLRDGGATVKERADMRTFIARFVRDDEGQDLVEYVLLIAVIGLAVAALIPPVAQAIVGVFDNVRARLGGGGGGGG